MKGKGILFAVLAGAGMIFTCYLTAKKAPEAVEKRNEALQKKREETGDENAELTPMESFQAQAPVYVPVAGAGIITLASVVASQIFPEKELKDSQKLFKTYKDISAKLHGPKVENLVSKMAEQKMSQGTDGLKKETFVLHFGNEDILFESTLLDVLTAEYDLNRLFSGLGYASFNQFLDFLHQEHADGGDDYGWDVYLGEVWYGYSWIDTKHRRGVLNGNPVTFIEFPFEPHPMDDEECEEYMTHGIEDA